MRNRWMNGVRGFKTVHPHQRSEECPLPNPNASLPNRLSYRSDLMREPCIPTRLKSTVLELEQVHQDGERAVAHLPVQRAAQLGHLLDQIREIQLVEAAGAQQVGLGLGPGVEIPLVGI